MDNGFEFRARKQLLVIPIVDASASMERNGNICRVNEAMREVAPQLVDVENENGVEILLASVVFNCNARWIGIGSNDMPVRPTDFSWTDFKAVGSADFSAACRLLADKLTSTEKGGWIDAQRGLRPILLFISNGDVDPGWEASFDTLAKRGWFKLAMKYAIAVEGASMPVLEKFTGNRETIYDTETLRTDLATLVKAIVLSVSCAVSDGSHDTIDKTVPSVNDEQGSEKELMNSPDNLSFWDDEDDFFSPPGFSSDFLSSGPDSILKGEGSAFDCDPVCRSEPVKKYGDIVCKSVTADFDADPICRSVALNFDADPICRSTVARFDSDDVACSCAPPSTMSLGILDSTELDMESEVPAQDGHVFISYESDNEKRAELLKAVNEAMSRHDDSDFLGDFASEAPPVTNAAREHYLENLPQGEGSVFPLVGGCIPDYSGCGNPFADRFSQHPYHVTPVKPNMPERIYVSRVQFSALVPKRFIKGEYSMIDITVYEDEFRQVVDRAIAESDTEVKEVSASPRDVAQNTDIRIVLFSPDIELEDCDETQTWRGGYLKYNFPVNVPNTYAKRQALFTATVYFNDVIATKLKFIVNCSTAIEQKLELIREDVLSAFVSYASQDRRDVATIIQGMKKARPDMNVFFDVESLRSGEDWESALRREIERRDILYLCWSHHARASKWVEHEWRYALENKGLDAIEPIPLVSPAECPPPEELKSKHFNDTALLYKKV